MSKKAAIFVIIIFILLVVGGFLAFYFYSNRGQGRDIFGTGGGTGIFPESPSGGGTTPTDSGTKIPPAEVSTDTQIPSILKELSKRASAGAVSPTASSSDMVMVRFVEQGTGNVYEVSPEFSTETRLSNTTIPKINEVLWNKTGTRLIARYTKDGEDDTVQSYYAELTNSGQSQGELQGSFLSENIEVMTKNPEQNKLFYILGHSGGSTGIISEFDGTKKIQILDSPLREWLVEWPSSGTIALTTKPSASVPGFLFLLNAKTGALTRAVSEIKGLTTLVSPDDSSVLYSENVSGDLSLKIYSFKSGVSEDATVTTLPEKCVWSRNDIEAVYCSVPTYIPNGLYPDGWYQGLVSFSDDIWKLNPKTGTGELLVRLKEATKKDIDGTNLFLSQKEEYLFFSNKNDSHLWSLRLKP